METYGLTAEQAGDGSPDVVWLLKEGIGDAHLYAAGDRLLFGADVLAGHKANDTVLWIESHCAVISGDTLVDFGQGLEINEQVAPPRRHPRGDRGAAATASGFRSSTCSRTHGGPTDRAALERALSLS